MAIFPATRALARSLGYEMYSNGKPCAQGHVAPRKVSDAHCITCNLHRGRARIAADPQKNRDRVRAWNKNNPGANQRRCAAWLEENRGRNRAACKSRYYADVDLTRAKKRAAYAADVETARQICRDWRRANPEKTRAINATMRAKRKGAEGKVTAEEIADITRMQSGRCCYCAEKKKLTIDHIIALSRGGQHVRSNIQMACMPCNQSKSARDPIEFARSRDLLL